MSRSRVGHIFLFAGSGSSRSGCADGAAKDALFHQPTGLICTPDKSVWVCDAGNACLRRIFKGNVQSFQISGLSRDKYAEAAADGTGVVVNVTPAAPAAVPAVPAAASAASAPAASASASAASAPAASAAAFAASAQSSVLNQLFDGVEYLASNTAGTIIWGTCTRCVFRCGKIPPPPRRRSLHSNTSHRYFLFVADVDAKESHKWTFCMCGAAPGLAILR
jgi:hypothetical protein